ncbi:translesion error-prone DNA polymerase V autoproteolytic subunit [Acinetobacter sp.]|uniref:LexA family protein n=1 Tax=Acinetobacter sp. TaxID=472 RepID=UPI0028176F87|nr:translesion error-prone DNA polymerase V autoproteolytic subunit [Acinetobacter sp.]MDR0238251.1 translesion error-prone DNA polymerase V autoproteolytic subunit [Acinetobacter sp.]
MQQYSQTKSGFVDPKAYPRHRITQQDMIIKDEISVQNLFFFRPHLKIEIPYPLETVAAGFPSPAQDYTEKKIDLNEHLIHNPIATFMLKVNSLSMKNAGIEIGDEILIDRSLNAEHGDVVLALINNEFTVKRFMQKKLATGLYDIWLKAENPDFPDIHPHSEEQIMIWGVVTCILKKLK